MKPETDATPLCTGCIFPSAALVTVGCVHEHLTQASYYEDKIDDLRDAAGYLTCAPCAEDHICAPRIEARWPDGRTEVIQEAGDIRPDEAWRLFGGQG